MPWAWRSRNAPYPWWWPAGSWRRPLRRKHRRAGWPVPDSTAAVPGRWWCSRKRWDPRRRSDGIVRIRWRPLIGSCCWNLPSGPSRDIVAAAAVVVAVVVGCSNWWPQTVRSGNWAGRCWKQKCWLRRWSRSRSTAGRKPVPLPCNSSILKYSNQ